MKAKKREWFHDFFSGLYAKVLPHSFSEAQNLHQARVIKRILGLRKGQRVLDIACGMGRITIPLARMGLLMTGVDLTDSYIKRARGLARKEGLDIDFIQSDMRDIDFDSEFDAALNWWTSFGYFSDEDSLEFCKRVCRALRPGGKFLIETMNRPWLQRHPHRQGDETLGGVRIVDTGGWSPAAGRIEATWTFSKGTVVEKRHLSLRVFGGAELRRLLEGAGFCDVRLFGGQTMSSMRLDRTPPLPRLTWRHRRLIAVAQRPKRERRRK